MSEESEQSSTPAAEQQIIARPATSYRVRYGLVCGAFFLFGLLCIKDGFIVWPAEFEASKRELASQGKGEEQAKHGGPYDIPLQKGLGIFLPIGSLALFVRYWLRARGQYILENNVLSVPGHPPIPLDKITAVDKRKLERKGLVIVHYEIPGGGSGQFRLDDVFYERKPTDEILARIEAALAQEEK